MADKKIADDRFHHWRQGADTKAQVVRDFDENAGRRLLEGPDDEHALGESLQMMKTHLGFFAVDDLLGRPGNWNARARRGHDDNVAIAIALKIFDVTIVRQDLWPVFQICRGLENFSTRCLHDN